MAESEEWRKLSPEMASFRLLVLAFVRDYLDRWSRSPSYGEIAEGLASNRVRVRKAVKSLATDGLLLRTPGPRGLCLPSMRDEAIRQLRELGWKVDEDIGHAAEPVTNRTLLPPPALDYFPDPIPPLRRGQAEGKHGKPGSARNREETRRTSAQGR